VMDSLSQNCSWFAGMKSKSNLLFTRQKNLRHLLLWGLMYSTELQNRALRIFKISHNRHVVVGRTGSLGSPPLPCLATLASYFLSSQVVMGYSDGQTVS